MASESGCPIEMFKIEVEKCDEIFDPDCKGDKYIPFHRAAYDRETGQSPNAPREQINQVTSWIDGSFIYSTSEPWLNAMRTFINGTMLTDPTGAMPVRNTMRVPLFNRPNPHQMRMTNAEELFCKLFCSLSQFTSTHPIFRSDFSAWRSTNKSKSSHSIACDSILALAQCSSATHQTNTSIMDRRRCFSTCPSHCHCFTAKCHYVRILAGTARLKNRTVRRLQSGYSSGHQSRFSSGRISLQPHNDSTRNLYAKFKVRLSSNACRIPSCSFVLNVVEFKCKFV